MVVHHRAVSLGSSSAKNDTSNQLLRRSIETLLAISRRYTVVQHYVGFEIYIYIEVAIITLISWPIRCLSARPLRSLGPRQLHDDIKNHTNALDSSLSLGEYQ